MQLRKIISLLLGILVASTSVYTFSAEKKNVSTSSHTQRKVITNTAKAKKERNSGQKKIHTATIKKQKKQLP